MTYHNYILLTAPLYQWKYIEGNENIAAKLKYIKEVYKNFDYQINKFKVK